MASPSRTPKGRGVLTRASSSPSLLNDDDLTGGFDSAAGRDVSSHKFGKGASALCPPPSSSQQKALSRNVTSLKGQNSYASSTVAHTSATSLPPPVTPSKALSCTVTSPAVASTSGTSAKSSGSRHPDSTPGTGTTNNSSSASQRRNRPSGDRPSSQASQVSLLTPGQTYAGAASGPGPSPNVNAAYDSFDEELPDRNAAVVCEAVEGFTLDDHLRALLPLVGARDILYASKISNKRVCVYLKQPWMADKVANSPPLFYKGSTISYRKYVSGALRIFLSNVQPDIPARALYNVLSRFGNVVGRIKRLKAACHDPEFGHVQGFRRLANLVVENPGVLPLSVPLTHHGTTYNIFLNLEDITCTACMQSGHHFSHCPGNGDAMYAGAVEVDDVQSAPVVQTQSPPPRDKSVKTSVSGHPNEEAVAMDAEPSTATLKRVRDSPTRESAKKQPRRKTGFAKSDVDTRDDSDISTTSSDTEKDRDRSLSPLPPDLSDQTFAQIMRDSANSQDLELYLEGLGVSRSSLVARLRKCLSNLPTNSRHSRKRLRYRTLLKRLKACSSE